MAVGVPGGMGASPTVPPLKQAGGSGCVVWGLVGCGVFAVLAVILVMITVYSVSKNPEVSKAFSGFNSIQGCSRKMATIRSAIESYRNDHKGAYPATLAELIPDYVSDKAQLQCGDDGTGAGNTMEYLRPAAKAPNDTVVVTIRTGSISIVPTQKQTLYIRLLKSGSIVSDQEVRTQLVPSDAPTGKEEQ